VNSNSTVPLWQALLLALAAGLVGTFARIAYERTAELRTRMIQAADDFTVALYRATMLAGEADTTIRMHRGPVRGSTANEFHPDIQEVIDGVKAQTDDTLERLTRVQLLFGIPGESATTAEGHANITALRNCANAIAHWPDSVTQDPARRTYDENYGRLIGGVDRFTAAARREIRAWTLVLWVRRRARRVRPFTERIWRVLTAPARRRT
jgi:hypothetical protein